MSDTDTTTLAEWLMARLDEDERSAQVMAEVYPPPWDLYDRGHSARVVAGEPNFLAVTQIDQQQAPTGDNWPGDFIAHIARHDPSRVLAEVAAKRALLKAVEDDPFDALGAERAYESLVWEYLALPYADQPGYRPEWAP